jgi:hypothetical protein
MATNRRPSRLGAVIAERTLERPGSKRRIFARLGTPRRNRTEWECPYQVAGAGDPRVRVAFGEDALQTIILACTGLRQELTRVQASWLGSGASGIPPMIPDMLGPEFTAHLESMVEGEVVKLVTKLRRAHERRTKR